MAMRDGDRLSFQVNGSPPVVYYDSFPLTATTPGSFALDVPAGQKIERLRFATQALPPNPSPLEHGDELYARGKFQEALDYYRQQELGDLTSEIGQEVRYKAGNCLMRLNRHEEAAPFMEDVAAAKGQRRPPQAAFQLWTIRLKQHKLEQVDAILLDLSHRFSADFLADRIPLEVAPAPAHSLYRAIARLQVHPLRRPAGTEAGRVVALVELFGARDYDRMHLRLSLARAYHIAGRYAEAMQTLEKILADESLAATWSDEKHRLLPWQIRVVEEYGSLHAPGRRSAQGLAGDRQAAAAPRQAPIARRMCRSWRKGPGSRPF